MHQSHVRFKPSDASSRSQCSADCTIGTHGFNLTQGQAAVPTVPTVTIRGGLVCSPRRWYDNLGHASPAMTLPDPNRCRRLIFALEGKNNEGLDPPTATCRDVYSRLDDHYAATAYPGATSAQPRLACSGYAVPSSKFERYRLCRTAHLCAQARSGRAGR